MLPSGRRTSATYGLLMVAEGRFSTSAGVSGGSVRSRVEGSCDAGGMVGGEERGGGSGAADSFCFFCFLPSLEEAAVESFSFFGFFLSLAEVAVDGFGRAEEARTLIARVFTGENDMWKDDVRGMERSARRRRYLGMRMMLSATVVRRLSPTKI
jgi:hypothetical protein